MAPNSTDTATSVPAWIDSAFKLSSLLGIAASFYMAYKSKEQAEANGKQLQTVRDDLELLKNKTLSTKQQQQIQVIKDLYNNLIEWKDCYCKYYRDGNVRRAIQKNVLTDETYTVFRNDFKQLFDGEETVVDTDCGKNRYVTITKLHKQWMNQCQKE